MVGGRAEWTRPFREAFEERTPLLVVFDPLARSLAADSLLHEIEINSSGLTPKALEVLRNEPLLAIPVRDILRRVGAPLRRLGFLELPKVDAFSDPDAEGPPVVRIVARAPKTMEWEEEMHAWDRLSEFVDQLLPTNEFKRRVIVSVEPG